MSQLIQACIYYGSDNDGKITKTKLAKLIYLSDFASYYFFDKPITNFEYKKLDQGPVAYEFFQTLHELQQDESISVVLKDKAKLISLVENIEPDLSNLTQEQEDKVKEICGKWKNRRTKEIVDFTHKQLPWMISFDKDVIPYSLIIQEEPSNVY